MRSAGVRRSAVVACLVIGVSGALPVASATADAPTLAPPCAVGLLVSDSADRSAAAPLDGSSLRRARFVFVDAPGSPGRDLAEATTPVAGVTFTLSRAGEAATVRTENLAPFDLAGTDARGAAEPLGTETLGDGAWTVSASWTFQAGRCAGAARSASATFLVDTSGGAPFGECALAAYVSTSPDRSAARPLADAVVRGKVYVFVRSALGSTRDLYPASTVLAGVRFSLDAADGTAGSAPYPGPPVTRTERVAPFDLAGGSGDRGGTGDPVATAWDGGRFPAGEYTLATAYTFADESIFGCGDSSHGSSATFTVTR